jgi:hypothetical protein
MSTILATLSNPKFRQWLYTVITIAVPILVSYGVVDANQVPLWLALAAAVLGTGTATISVAKQRAAGVLPTPERKTPRRRRPKPQAPTTADLKPPQ